MNFLTKFILSCSFLALLPISLNAQNQTNYWYFGNKTGLNFKYSPPRVWSNSQMDAYAGGITVSDSSGKLLFYSNGKMIWDNRHYTIAKGLKCTYHSNSLIALPLPNKPSLYYIFHMGNLKPFFPKKGVHYNNHSLFYTLVNTQKQKSSEKLVKKNVWIEEGFTSGIATMLHANQRDYWVVTRDTINTLYAYRLTPNGFENQPVKSTIGRPINTQKLVLLSQLKFNSSGNTIAMINYVNNVIDMYDFDAKTGKFSRNRLLKTSPETYINSIEFSPSGQKLYALASTSEQEEESRNELYQFNLSNNSHKVIYKVDVSQNPNLGLSGLQLAKNGKIYVAQNRYRYLGVIQFPERNGKACLYESNAIDLKGKIAKMGLPTFPAHYFRSTDKIGIGTPFKRNIEFASGQAIIQPQYYKLIDDIAEFLKKNPKTSIHITGHTDNMGQPKSNLILSKKRAQAVAKYLNQKGIKVDRIETTGEGSKSPIANNQAPRGRRKNRRIEFFIK